jgi:hypothetical protein
MPKDLSISPSSRVSLAINNFFSNFFRALNYLNGKLSFIISNYSVNKKVKIYVTRKMNILPFSDIFIQNASISVSIFLIISFISLKIPFASFGPILLKSAASFSLLSSFFAKISI